MIVFDFVSEYISVEDMDYFNTVAKMMGFNVNSQLVYIPGDNTICTLANGVMLVKLTFMPVIIGYDSDSDIVYIKFNGGKKDDKKRETDKEE